MSTTDTLSFLKPFWDETIHRFSLDNGLKVSFKPDNRSPLCSLQLWIQSGSIHEGEWLGSGLSHFVEHMVFKGTQAYEGSQISKEIQALGGSFNAYTSFERTVYYINLPSESYLKGLSILSQLGFHATFPEEEIEKERKVIFREIDMGEDDPARSLSRKSFETAFIRHPYRHPVIGHRSLFAQLQRSDLIRYYQSRYLPNNAHLVISGDLEIGPLKDTLNSYFGDLNPKPVKPVLIETEPTQLSTRIHRMYGNYHLCYGNLLFQIPGMRHPDSIGLELLAHLLGGGESSRLWQSIREDQKLAYQIDASVWNPGEMGLFMISYVCDPDKETALTQAIRACLNSVIEDPFNEADYQKCIHQMQTAEVANRKTIEGQASRLGFTDVFMKEPNYIQHYFERLLRFDIQSLKDLNARYLLNNVSCQVSLLPEAKPEKTSTHPHLPRPLNQPETLTLHNGLRVLLYEDSQLPLLSVSIAGLRGLDYVTKGHAGACNLMANLMTKDTAGRSALEVKQAIESMGGRLNHFCGNNSFGFSLESLAQHAQPALDLLRSAIQEPLFNKEAFDHERKAQIAEIEEDSDDSLSYSMRTLRKAFFNTHPYAHDFLGDIEALTALEPSAMKTLHEGLITASNLVVSLSYPKAIRKNLDPFLEALSQLAPGQTPPDLPNPGALNKREPIVLTENRKQAIVLQAYPGSGVQGIDGFFREELLDELMSGMSSQLFEEVREKRNMAYFVGASRSVGLKTGLFMLYAGTHARHIDAVFEAFDHEIKRIQSGNVTQEELDAAKKKCIIQKRKSMQHGGAKAAYWCLQHLYGLPVQDPLFFESQINRIRKEDLQAHAHAHFQSPQRLQLRPSSV